MSRFGYRLWNRHQQKRLLEIFFRVAEIQQRFPGMGIGLYICEQITKTHGGTLWVQSEKDPPSVLHYQLRQILTDQEFSDHAVKVMASLGLVFMLLIGLICLILSDQKPVKDGEYISYEYELMIFNSDVHRAELLTK